MVDKHLLWQLVIHGSTWTLFGGVGTNVCTERRLVGGFYSDQKEVKSEAAFRNPS